jgi:hypothetical protein
MPLVEVGASLHGRTVEQESLLGLLGDARIGRSGAVVVVGASVVGSRLSVDVVRSDASSCATVDGSSDSLTQAPSPTRGMTPIAA